MPIPSPTPRPINAGLGASLLHAFLAKATWTAGTAGWVDDTEGRGKKLSEVPWPQVTASELRPDDLHTFSAGGKGSVQGHKRQ